MNRRNAKTGAMVSMVACCMVMASCAKMGVSKIEGTWTQPIPGMTDQVQGFKLNADGTAESVNMATLKYNSWRLCGYDTLLLVGSSIGNGTSSHFTDTLTIKVLTEDSLHLTRGIMTVKYARATE